MLSDRVDNQSAWLAAAGVAAGVAMALYAKKHIRQYSFENRVVLITGGSRGLGLVLARHFVDEGAKVALIARDAEELERAEDDIRGRGGVAAGFVCDVRNRDQVEETVERVVSHFGRLDVLVNNAGVIQVGPFNMMDIEDFEESVETHIYGPLYFAYAALPHLRKCDEARIVNVSSIGGQVALPHMPTYCTGKFGLVGLSDSMRMALRRENIYVTTVCPGPMRAGSPPNASYKGQHKFEYAWFAIADAIPVFSMQIDRAAHRMIEACRNGDALLTIGLPSIVARWMNSLFPGSVAEIASLFGRVLPSPGQHKADGHESRSGWRSESRWAPSFLTTLSDRAAQRNNEVPSST